MISLHTENLNLQLENNKIKWTSDNTVLQSALNSDIFRMVLDDGKTREITVFGKEQEIESVTKTQNGFDIFYNKIKAEDGRTFNIKYTIHIEKSGSGFDFTSEVTNNDDIRVNEIQVPFVELNKIADNNRENDILYMPEGLGKKIANPWETVQRDFHTEYIAADYNEIWYALSYPFPASMGWFGVESNGYFMYLGKQDTGFKTCSLNLGTGAREEEIPRLVLTISNYPAILKGETITTGLTHLELFKGGYEKGSEFYSEWAKKTWYKPLLKPTWVKELTGWQRIIMKHQYGEIFFKYKDLVDLYKQGEKYGIKMLLVFGWWKGGFDNGYPAYEPDPLLGGEEELKKAIKEIQDLGGYVALYGQGVLLDVNTDYYKETGHKISRKNIEGIEYREAYQFSNNGTMLKLFGYKTFASACQATDEWKNKLVEVGKNHFSYEPDSIFFDQVAGHIPKLCFDNTHKHKNRVDDESVFRCENLKEIVNLCGENQAFGSENTVDTFCPYIHYHHGHMSGTWYSKNAFPQMFKITFPDEISSNRLLHDERKDYMQQLNYAFTYGLIFDISIYRGRVVGLEKCPNYGEYVKMLIDKKEQYKDFFYYGKMVKGDNLSLPEGVVSQAYKNQKGETLICLWNNTEEEKTFEIFGKKVNMPKQSIDLVKEK